MSTRVVFAPTRRLSIQPIPYPVRIEQIYAPTLALDHPLRRTPRCGRLRQVAEVGVGSRGGGEGLGTFDDVSRDLRESPYRMDLDLASVPDGTYQVHVDVMDGAEITQARRAYGLSRRRDLDSALRRLESAANAVPESLRSDVLYPIEYVHNVNRGRYDIGAFDVNKEIATAEATLADAKSGKNPFAGRTGDFKRHYFLTEAGDIMPYRLFIPQVTTAPAHFLWYSRCTGWAGPKTRCSAQITR